MGIDNSEFAEVEFKVIPSIGSPSVSYIQARDLVLVLSQSDDED